MVDDYPLYESDPTAAPQAAESDDRYTPGSASRAVRETSKAVGVTPAAFFFLARALRRTQ
jgi:hypothetical protein